MPSSLFPPPSPLFSAVPIDDGGLGDSVLLFVPGTRPERFATAVEAGADAIIIDLEDAVSMAEKTAARDAVVTSFPSRGRVFLRINPMGTPWHGEDLALATRLPLAGVVLPKAERCEDIKAIAVVLGRDVPIVALIESALGVAEARQIAAMPQVARLAFGSIDFSADIGSAHSREALLAARSELVLAARLAAQSGPIDGVTSAVADEALAEEDASYGASLGFAGKLCIHPRQIAPVRRGLAPAADEIEWAKRVVASLADGNAVLAVDGAMVDAPVRLRAERILARARVSDMANRPRPSGTKHGQ